MSVQRVTQALPMRCFPISLEEVRDIKNHSRSSLSYPFYLSVEENNVLYPRALCPEVTNATALVYLEDSMLGIKNQDPQQETWKEIQEVYSNHREKTGEMNRIQELNSSLLPQEMR